MKGSRDLEGRVMGFEDEMANGVVKWFNPAKGFGFIQPDSGQEKL